MGHASFKIKGKSASVVTDPFDPKVVGFTPPAPENVDLVTVSHDHADHNFVSRVKEKNPDAFVISGPGEYEARGVTVFGYGAFHDKSNGAERGKNTIFRIVLDDINVCHLGDLGHKLSDALVEKIDNVDILMVPVGGGFSLEPEVAAEVVAQLAPSIVIPMHYKTPKHNPEVFAKLAGVAEFLKAMGKENISPIPKLSVSKDKLPEELQVVVLE